MCFPLLRAANLLNRLYRPVLGELGKAALADRRTKDLDRYFPEGIDPPGIMLIRVDATAIRHWDGSEEGEIAI